MTTEPGRKRGGNRGAGESGNYDSEPLIDVRAVAEMCGVSTWMLYKMARTGRMPKPIKIGRLLRWKRLEVKKWITGGCKPLKVQKGARSNG